MVGNETDRPYLSTMRMSAELKVDARIFRIRQVVRLMIQKDNRFCRINVFHQFLQGLPGFIAAVVSSDYSYTARQCYDIVSQ